MAHETSKTIAFIEKTIRLPLVITGIVMGAILLACTREVPSMTPAATPSRTASEWEPGIPPIDGDVPAQTETATFALG